MIAVSISYKNFFTVDLDSEQNYTINKYDLLIENNIYYKIDEILDKKYYKIIIDEILPKQTVSKKILEIYNYILEKYKKKIFKVNLEKLKEFLKINEDDNYFKQKMKFKKVAKTNFPSLFNKSEDLLDNYSFIECLCNFLYYKQCIYKNY